MLGNAKVISYEDLEEARAKRVRKESIQAAKGKEICGRKRKRGTPEAEEGTTETARRGRKRKSAAPELSNKMTRVGKVPSPARASVVQMSRTPIAEDEIVPKSWRAPVARMY